MPRPAGRLSLATVGALGSQRFLVATAGVLTARLLGPADKGLLAMLTLGATALGLAGTCGVDVWAARGSTSTGALATVRGVVRRQLLVGVAVVGLATLVALVVSTSMDGVAASEMLGVAAMAIGTVVFLLVTGLAVNAEAWRGWVGAHVADGALFLGACLVLLLVDVPSVAVVLLAGFGARIVASASAALPLRGSAATGVARQHRAALRLGLPASLGGILLMATYRVDVFVLAALRPSSDVGLYVTAAALSEALWLFPDAATPVILRRSGPGGDLDVPLIVRTTVAVLVAGGGLLVALGDPIVTVLFGAEFRDASAALPGLWVAAIALGLWKLLVADLAAHGETGVRVWTSALAIGLMVVADVVLIPSHGISGAAWGSAIGYSVAAAGALHAERRLGHWSNEPLLVIRPGDVRPVSDLLMRRTAR